MWKQQSHCIVNNKLSYMKLTIVLLWLLISNECISQKDVLVYDSLLNVVKSKHKSVVQVDLRIRSKEYKITQINVDSLQFSMIKVLKPDGDEGFNYMRGFFLRYKNQLLLYRGSNFSESSSTINDVFQVVAMDTNYNIEYVLHFSHDVLIGISKIEHIASKNIELFCLILSSYERERMHLSKMDIYKIGDRNWLSKLFYSQSTSEPNIVYVKAHTKAELFNEFMENSPERL
jgi:hypothetical protein